MGGYRHGAVTCGGCVVCIVYLVEVCVCVGCMYCLCFSGGLWKSDDLVPVGKDKEIILCEKTLNKKIGLVNQRLQPYIVPETAAGVCCPALSRWGFHYLKPAVLVQIVGTPGFLLSPKHQHRIAHSSLRHRRPNGQSEILYMFYIGLAEPPFVRGM